MNKLCMALPVLLLCSCTSMRGEPHDVGAPYIYMTELESAKAEKLEDGKYRLTFKWDYPIEHLTLSGPVSSMQWLRSSDPINWESIDEDHKVFTAVVHPPSEGWFIRLSWLIAGGMMQPSKTLYFNGRQFIACGEVDAGVFEMTNYGVEQAHLPPPELPPKYEFFFVRGHTAFASEELVANEEGDLWLFVRSWIPLQEATLYRQTLEAYKARRGSSQQIELDAHNSSLYRSYVFCIKAGQDLISELSEGRVLKLQVKSRDGNDLPPLNFYVSRKSGIIRLSSPEKISREIALKGTPVWEVKHR